MSDEKEDEKMLMQMRSYVSKEPCHVYSLDTCKKMLKERDKERDASIARQARLGEHKKMEDMIDDQEKTSSRCNGRQSLGSLRLKLEARKDQIQSGEDSVGDSDCVATKEPLLSKQQKPAPSKPAPEKDEVCGESGCINPAVYTRDENSRVGRLWFCEAHKKCENATNDYGGLYSALIRLDEIHQPVVFTPALLAEACEKLAEDEELVNLVWSRFKIKISHQDIMDVLNTTKGVLRERGKANKQRR